MTKTIAGVAVAAKTPLVSSFAKFVIGDIKGGAHAIAFRQETIRNAIEQLFKGNYSPITEAKTLTQGIAKKARAYHAGFATFGVIGTDTCKVPYVGSLNSADNKGVRDAIDSKTQHAFANFFIAFDAVMAEKATPKAKAVPAEVAAPVADAVGSDADTDDTATDDVRHDAAVAQDDMVAAVVRMIQTGMLTSAQMEAIDEALLTVETRLLMAQQPQFEMVAH